MNGVLFKIMVVCHRVIRGIANRVLDKNQIRPRNFSNIMLAKYARHFSGDVVNVSGWRDADGQGGFYRDYFRSATSYSVSNIRDQFKGIGSLAQGYNEMELDLAKPLRQELEGKFDVVFNHTTLEHIYEFQIAFDNLCRLSRDAVILVVPVMQQIHHTSDFGDYWRPTTMTIAKMFLDNGLTPIVLKCNDQPFAPIYCFAIAARDPRKYEDKLDKDIELEMGKYNYGSSLNTKQMHNLLNLRG